MKKIKKLFLYRELREIHMDGTSNKAVEDAISSALSKRLGIRLPVMITILDEHTVSVFYNFKPTIPESTIIGDKSMPEEYLLILINGEGKDYQAPHTVGYAPRFGGYFQIMIQPEDVERIMKANNRELHGNRIKSVSTLQSSSGFEIQVMFG